MLGAAGSIGSALCRRLAKLKPKKLVLLDYDETGIFDIYEELKEKANVDYVIANIRDADAMFDTFGWYNPDIVFHAAAYKHIALMERYPEEARKTNVEGLKNVIDAAIGTKTEKFIFISSDKAVNPTCVMGKTKKIGEELCLEDKLFGDTKFIVVRFGNVMPSRGSVVPIFQKQIAEGKNLTVTDRKMKRYFMGIYDAVELVLRATVLGKGGEIMVLDMGEEVYIEKLAKLMIKLSGKDLKIRYTKVQKGEKYAEELMTKDEAARAIKQKGLWIIPPRDTNSGETEE